MSTALSNAGDKAREVAKEDFNKAKLLAQSAVKS